MLLVSGFAAVGGYYEFEFKYNRAVPISVLENITSDHAKCGMPSANAFRLIRGLDDPLPWPGVFGGLTISCIWYWCTDQVSLYFFIT